jgi:uncharacterized metal-binding protein
MPDLPKRKVGIVACSGEELAEGTVTRLAALRVLEDLRPGDTVTICLPLFLAGGEGDRAFARFYPTIAVDGCEKRCAARATERYSARPAASVIVSELIARQRLGRPAGARRLDDAGLRAVELTAEHVVSLVDGLLGAPRDLVRGSSAPEAVPTRVEDSAPATCACGSAVPVQRIEVNGRTVPIAALPLIFEQFRDAGKAPGAAATRELLDVVRIYNDLPAATDDDYLAALDRAYAAFWEQQEVAR